MTQIPIPYTLIFMPRTQSAKKALRQNIKRRAHNTERKGKLQETVKRFKKLLAEGKKEDARTYLSTAYKTVDKMAKVNLIRKNKASRIKSRLTKLLIAS